MIEWAVQNPDGAGFLMFCVIVAGTLVAIFLVFALFGAVSSVGTARSRARIAEARAREAEAKTRRAELLGPAAVECEQVDLAKG
jgi:hypothetical protein